VDVRIGMTQVPREIEIDIADDAREATVEKITAALSSGEGTLSLVDRKGRTVMVAAAKIAYAEIGGPAEERRVGFGR
jgi:hypothetical protein